MMTEKNTRRLRFWSKPDVFAWLTEREDMIFEKYLEIGNYQRVIDWLAPQMEGKLSKLSYQTWYAWLHDTDERWEKWQKRSPYEKQNHLTLWHHFCGRLCPPHDTLSRSWRCVTGRRSCGHRTCCTG